MQYSDWKYVIDVLGFYNHVPIGLTPSLSPTYESWVDPKINHKRICLLSE